MPTKAVNKVSLKFKQSHSLNYIVGLFYSFSDLIVFLPSNRYLKIHHENAFFNLNL